MRGRPAVTRARVLGYIEAHNPETVAQIARALSVDRSQVYRVLRAVYGPDFREKWGLQSRPHRPDALMDLPTDTVERFYSKIVKDDGGCWIWQASRQKAGYGRLRLSNGLTVCATHLSLVLSGKPRPNQLLALHSCDNPACVNPEHLRWGTDAENHEDVRKRGKRGRHWLPDDVVHLIHKSDEPHLSLANKIGVTASCVCNIRRGVSHKHIFDLYCHTTQARKIR